MNPFIRRLETFGPLSEADRATLERISANGQLMGPRVDIIREGHAPDGIVLVMNGIACRQKHRANGARQITAYVVPGDVCAVDTMLLGRIDHTITTLSVCRVVRIPRAVVLRLTTEHPAITHALRMGSLVEAATLREWLMNVGCRSAIERIAHLFCELLVRLQAVGLAGEDVFELPITQLDIADTLGLSNVHVNRSLQDMRRKGLIELKGKTLRILDRSRLRVLAEFDAAYLHMGRRTAA